MSEITGSLTAEALFNSELDAASSASSESAPPRAAAHAMLQTKRGLLLLNLGTPDEPQPEAVGRYLKQFLMDKWVIDNPWPIRWFVVNLLIVPKRKFASAHAYQTIWSSERGSPLLFHTRDLEQAIKPLLEDWETTVAMRYGNPSIEAGLKELFERGVTEVTVFPLYPQYAESSTRSSVEECRRIARKLGKEDALAFVPAFYDHPKFIEAFANRIRTVWETERPDHLLMSFHGLPERHIKKTDRSGGEHCLTRPDCCAKITDANRDCYRAQSFATARALTRAVGLRDDQVTVSFQSRLGRTPWIKPYTDVLMKEFASKGIKKLAVVCPSFVADCLETVEEIGIRGREDFMSTGGKEYSAIPCINSDPAWAEAVVEIVKSGARV